MVKRAIDSVLAQSYPALEVIVIDDGSSDNTRAVVEAAARGDRSVVYHYQDNAGCATARNRGLALATGELVAFLDSDDEWLPRAAEHMAGAIDAAGADFVYTPSLERYDDGTWRLVPPVAAGRPKVLAQKHFHRPGLRNGAYLVRTVVARQTGGFDESLRHNEDSDFVQRLAIDAVAAYCDDPTVIVSIHSGSKSQNREEMARALLRSAQSVLLSRPEFSRRLGGRANARLAHLRSRLIEELLLSSQFDEARRMATHDGECSLVVRLALFTHSLLPIRCKRKLEQYGRGVRRRYLAVTGRGVRPATKPLPGI